MGRGVGEGEGVEVGTGVGVGSLSQHPDSDAARTRPSNATNGLDLCTLASRLWAGPL